MNSTVVLGRLFRCEICGSEMLVLNPATGELDLHCCNQPMDPIDPPVPIYHCDLCGAEAAALRSDGGELEMICCNQPMNQLEPTGVAA